MCVLFVWILERLIDLKQLSFPSLIADWQRRLEIAVPHQNHPSPSDHMHTHSIAERLEEAERERAAGAAEDGSGSSNQQEAWDAVYSSASKLLALARQCEARRALAAAEAKVRLLCCCDRSDCKEHTFVITT